MIRVGESNEEEDNSSSDGGIIVTLVLSVTSCTTVSSTLQRIVAMTPRLTRLPPPWLRERRMVILLSLLLEI
jgi:hypothetical protein